MDIEITMTGKDKNGDIISICNGIDYFSKDDAIIRIKYNILRFYVKQRGYIPVYIKVVNRNGKEYLKTVSDGNDPNNLDNLPDCIGP